MVNGEGHPFDNKGATADTHAGRRRSSSSSMMMMGGRRTFHPNVVSSRSSRSIILLWR